MKSIKWVRKTYRGWPSHFICAGRCRFRLNTLLEYKNLSIVVSTVGLMENWHNKGTPFKPDGFDTIGHERYFETMAFHAREDKWKDADVIRPVSLRGPWRIDHCREGSEMEAQAVHDLAVEEISFRMIHGDLE